jgi:hypothetical protein
MIPIDRAKDLVSKFGKELAPKVVDEICDLLEDNGLTFTEYHDKTTIEYWWQVKAELITFK